MGDFFKPCLEDAKEVLGDVNDIVPLFTDFQKYLYQSKVA
jgi:hypothetical protein